MRRALSSDSAIPQGELIRTRYACMGGLETIGMLKPVLITPSRGDGEKEEGEKGETSTPYDVEDQIYTSVPARLACLL